MMISPQTYISRFKSAKYTDLIKERDRLINELREFEQNEMTGDRSGEEWLMDPNPEVMYQCSLDYLAELCELMRDRYNNESEWSEE